MNHSMDTMNRMVDRGQQEVAVTGDEYKDRTECLFTRLNDDKNPHIKNVRVVSTIVYYLDD